ncbi:MAG: hypothetical protein JWP69_2435 [Flaviaesturariibacter sp.]|nr:hypothetical protein [Flaviaesturariibacter sp.]
MNSSEEIKKWAKSIVTLWRSQDIKIEKGASMQLLSKAEAYLEISFPEPFKTLYMEANGFKDMDWNEHMFSFWSVERIIEEYDYKRHPNFVGFCDFLINSHWIGFVKNESGIYKRYDFEGPERIADNFEDAVDLINTSADVIY